jgi:TonB family protein
MDEQGRTPADAPDSSWGARLRRHRARPPRRFVIASVGLHAAIVALLLASGLRFSRPIEYQQFRVTLVSPPPVQAAPVPEPVTQTTTPVIVETTPPPPQPKPEPPKPHPLRTQAPQQRPPEPKPEPPKPARGPDPKPAAVGGENIQVVQAGQEFMFPEYLENIMLQLYRYFRWSGPATLEAELTFYINRDGSVGGIRVVNRSGNFQFDSGAVEAVDQAGRARAFGALPTGWQADRLYVRYTFKPDR